MLKHDHYFAVSARDGSMKPGEYLGDGLWSGDTRILSGFRLLIDGIEPVTVGFHSDEASATFELQAGSLRLMRVRFIDSRLRQLIAVAKEGASTLHPVP